MSSLDPPDHGEIRAVVSRAFTPRRVARAESDIRVLAVGLIEQFMRGANAMRCGFFLTAAQHGHRSLIGIPDELVLRSVVRSPTTTCVRHHRPRTSNPARSYEIFAELYDERRERPRDDLLSALWPQRSTATVDRDELLAFDG